MIRVKIKQVLLFFNAGLFTFMSSHVVTASVDPPNILMICVDDLNDWVGFLGGHPQAKTPNMDCKQPPKASPRPAQASAKASKAFQNIPGAHKTAPGI